MALSLTMEERLQIGAYLTIVCLSVPANVFVICLLSRSPRLRTASNCLVLVQCFIDLLAVLVTITEAIVALTTGNYLQGLACHVKGFTNEMLRSLMLLNLAAIAIGRYVTIVAQFDSAFTYCHVIKLCTASLIVAAVSSLPPLVGYGKYDFNQATFICSVKWTDGSVSMVFNFQLILLTIFLPFFLISWAYKKVLDFLKTKHKRAQSASTLSRSSRTSTKSDVQKRGKSAESSITRLTVQNVTSISLEGDENDRQSRASVAEEETGSGSDVIRESLHRSVMRTRQTVTLLLGTHLAVWAPYTLLAVYYTVTTDRWPLPGIVDFLTLWLAYSSAVWHVLIYSLVNQHVREAVPRSRIRHVLKGMTQCFGEIALSGPLCGVNSGSEHQASLPVSQQDRTDTETTYVNSGEEDTLPVSHDNESPQLQTSPHSTRPLHLTTSSATLPTRLGAKRHVLQLNPSLTLQSKARLDYSRKGIGTVKPMQHYCKLTGRNGVNKPRSEGSSESYRHGSTGKCSSKISYTEASQLSCLSLTEVPARSYSFLKALEQSDDSDSSGMGESCSTDSSLAFSRAKLRTGYLKMQATRKIALNGSSKPSKARHCRRKPAGMSDFSSDSDITMVVPSTQVHHFRTAACISLPSIIPERDDELIVRCRTPKLRTQLEKEESSSGCDDERSCASDKVRVVPTHTYENIPQKIHSYENIPSLTSDIESERWPVSHPKTPVQNVSIVPVIVLHSDEHSCDIHEDCRSDNGASKCAAVPKQFFFRPAEAVNYPTEGDAHSPKYSTTNEKQIQISELNMNDKVICRSTEETGSNEKPSMPSPAIHLPHGSPDSDIEGPEHAGDRREWYDLNPDPNVHVTEKLSAVNISSTRDKDVGFEIVWVVDQLDVQAIECDVSSGCLQQRKESLV